MTTQLVTFTAVDLKADPATRELSGMLLPFGEVSRPARDPQSGMVAQFTFPDASTIALGDPADHILNFGHDRESLTAQVGIAKALEATDAGVLATYKIARTPEGDRVLALAEDGILRSFSAEVAGTFETNAAGVQTAVSTVLTGGAVVVRPAFASAGITHVAASAATTQETHMPEIDTAPEFTAAQGADLMAQVADLSTKLAELEKVKLPVGPGTQQFHVAEEPIYRFAGTTPAPSGFDFAQDLLLAAKNGDGAALKRVQDFTAAHLKPGAAGDPQLAPQFVASANVATVNPSSYRPDMFLGQAPIPASPLYDTFYKGGLDNITPFFWSKLDRASTNVGVADHVEGTDPALTNLLTMTGTTVTPIPVSGRVHITREVNDQGGNPLISGLVWNEFDRSFKIALETKTSALALAAVGSYTALATIATGTSGLAAGAAVESGLVDLQFLADGFRFTKAFGHVDLYKALAGAVLTTTGEKVYPIIAPSNRDGSTAEKFAHINIAGYELNPAASLGTTGGTKNSLVADPYAIHVWNSGLTQLDKLTEKVEGWDLGVFAYFAGVVYDATGVRKITYTP